MNQMVRYDAMVHAIAECHRVDEVKDIRDKAMALEAYARQAKNTEAERKAADVRLRAERRTGELLKDLARGEAGRPPKKNTPNDADNFSQSEYSRALDSAGLSTQSASRYQQLANVPEEQFERDRPDLADQVIKGDLSAHAAAIVAGFRKPSLTLQANNPAHAAERIRDVLGADFANQLKEAL